MKKFFAMLAIMLPMAVMAQEGKDTTVVIPQAEDAFRLATQLSKYGYANNDALSLIQAARLSKQNNFTLKQMDKAETGGAQSATDEGKKNGQVSLDPAKLLADAKVIAGNNGALLALIDEASRGTRGAYDGPVYHVDRVSANSWDAYNITFRAHETAIVYVSGDGDTDLDLYIYDSNGNLIDSDTDYTDECVCTWTPRWTGNFRIKIINRGSVYNRYVLRTN